MFLVEFGAGVPLTGTEATPAGQQVVQISPETRQAETFFTVNPGALGPKGTESLSTPGSKHPVEACFSLDGTALYVVDFGAFKPYLAGAFPNPRPFSLAPA